MADFWYNRAFLRLMTGDLDMEEGNADLRVLLLTTDAEDFDHDNLAAVITAGAVECAASGYARQALGSQTATLDDTNNRSIFDAANSVFTGVAASAAVVAGIVYQHIDGTNANDIPILHIDSGFPVTPNGSDITINYAAAGIAAISQP